jgi:hypothetical protein
MLAERDDTRAVNEVRISALATLQTRHAELPVER